MTSTKWIVGAKAWLVPAGGGAPCEVTIAKVGRKYVTLEGARVYEFHIETGKEKTSSNQVWSASRQLYASKAEWDAIVTRHKAWGDLRMAVDYPTAPEGMPTETIQTALKLLMEK